MFTALTITAVALLALASMAFGQDLSGTYVMSAQNVTLTLVLRQDGQGNLTGTLSSTSGARFQVDGKIQDGVGIGTCVDNQGGSYFEAHPQGDKLLFAMIEPGPDRKPDYNKVRKLLFAKQTGPPGAVGGGFPPGGQGPFGSGGMPGQGTGPFGSGAAPSSPGYGFPPPTPPQQAPGFGQQSPQPFGQGGAPPPSGAAVSDPAWPFTFAVPSGWKYQKTERGAVLGHDSIPGLILVMSHEVGNLQELQAEMNQGIQEEDLQLMPTGGLQRAGTNALVGEYTGMAQGTQVRARGIGVLSPGGGGAYIIAMTTPQAFGSPLVSAAEAIAQSLRPAATDASDLVRHFAGTWVTMTKSTQTMITLYPNGTFARRYEAGYSGQFSNSLGQNTGAWGTARDEHAQGRWTVRGTRQQGVLVLTDRNGSQATVRYQVHVEKGQTYWREYFFDGNLYGKQ